MRYGLLKTLRTSDTCKCKKRMGSSIAINLHELAVQLQGEIATHVINPIAFLPQLTATSDVTDTIPSFVSCSDSVNLVNIRRLLLRHRNLLHTTNRLNIQESNL